MFSNLGIDSPCEAFNNGTALHIACMNMCIKSAHILLKHGANIDQLDNSGRKPFGKVKYFFFYSKEFFLIKNLKSIFRRKPRLKIQTTSREKIILNVI